MDIQKIYQERFLLEKEYGGEDKPVNKIQPLVSVCVITYQHVAFIKDCLEGILMQQTDFPFEIIIGEDESTDGTREICIEYANKYPDKIRLFLRDRKTSQLFDETGKYICRFNGKWNRESARGKYIALCEGDDYWTDPLKLQKQVGFLRQNSDCSLVFTGSLIRKANGEEKTIQYDGLGKVNADQYLNNSYYMATASLLFDKKVLETQKENWMALSFAGDFILRYRALTVGKIGYINDITCVYNKSVEGSWSKRILTKKMIIKEYSDNMRGLYFIDRQSRIEKGIKKKKIKKLKQMVYFKMALSKRHFNGFCYLIVNFRKISMFYLSAYLKRKILS